MMQFQDWNEMAGFLMLVMQPSSGIWMSSWVKLSPSSTFVTNSKEYIGQILRRHSCKAIISNYMSIMYVKFSNSSF